MNVQNEMEMKAFLDDFAKKSYTEIFNIRSRLEQSEWERKALTNLRETIFQNKNKYPNTKNVLYIHIPFCVTRCDYCPYYTHPYNPMLVSEYLNALEKEILSIKDTPFIKSTVFSSLYFGGGTPSLLSVDHIKRLSEVIFNNFSFDIGAELSFESNPSTLTEEKIKTLRNCGFNRVSLGIQTFNDQLLKEMSCAHTSEKARSVINLLFEYGFIVNTDMIYGLIGQTENDLERDLHELCQCKAPHQVTLFPLRIAEHTPLGEELQKKEGITIQSHFNRLLEYDSLAEKILLANQFSREESPVFYYKEGSIPHKYSSTETRIVGLGAGAGTLLDEGEGCNYYDVREYISAVNENRSPALSGIRLTQQQAYERFVLYRILYMNRSSSDFRENLEKGFYEYYNTSLSNKIHLKVLSDMERMKFIKTTNEEIIFTDRLWRVLNKVKIGMPSII
ncbi:coproporphyrinogen-III oxidase family protein [Pelosinus baikalensis]|uniref:Heme chaperone HemW n=1 Tax=Pelosinus baikalensis TaxID=2892015 RepID=A0ABS8HZ69_9FIRM|nr:radical SAM protein [Pelosinus baikalensis]MCC5468454.1 radical SAM protein [Pelosinus baikalensis]